MSYKKLELTSRNAVVVGGTSGIGLTIAKGLAQAGANVIATGRREHLVEAAAEEIRKIGTQSLAIPCDVGDAASIQEVLRGAMKEWGSVDILVNSAGTTKRAPTLDVSQSDWDSILDTNLNGTLRSCQIFGRHMIERKYGRIINIGSIASILALYEVTAYCASKAAVAALTKSLGIEWAKHGVCVNAILPGVFRTDLNAKLLDGTARGAEFLVRTPMGRFGQLEELVGAAIFLASEAASFVTGHLLAVDGGILVSGVNQ